ncbi:unnamed protein product [Gadus morhua 'NCC']
MKSLTQSNNAAAPTVEHDHFLHERSKSQALKAAQHGTFWLGERDTSVLIDNLSPVSEQEGSMPVFILLRSLVVRLLSSKLAGSLVQFLRRTLATGASHIAAALRHVWDRLRSQESKEAILGCVLCILNMHKKVET